MVRLTPNCSFKRSTAIDRACLLQTLTSFFALITGPNSAYIPEFGGNQPDSRALFDKRKPITITVGGGSGGSNPNPPVTTAAPKPQPTQPAEGGKTVTVTVTKTKTKTVTVRPTCRP